MLPAERSSVVLATVWLFFLLLGYFMIRPVRETLGSVAGTKQLQGLFLASFLMMLAVVPAYGALVKWLPRRWLVRVVYHFFAACLLGFWALLRVDSEVVQSWTAWALFVWISVFGLFATSVFWSVLADLFSSDQGKRLFGLVASGGTAGAIVGSLLTSQLADNLTTGQLVLLPIVVIEAGLWCAWRLEKQASKLKTADPLPIESKTPEDKPTGGGLWSGITHILKSPYLAMICLFLFFVQACGTQLYFEQAEIVNAKVVGEEDKTALFAYLDLGTQLLTLFAQLFLSGFILRRLGTSVALVILPLVYLISFSALALSPSLGVLVVVVILGRATGYGITVPAREVLFTVVSREDKYKSKNFIDTVVLRGGDALSGQIFGALRGMNLGLRGLNLCFIPVVAVWALVAWRLGRRQEKLARASSAMPVPSEPDGHH
ncbi:MAG: NTP/NDP exchange transporter [Rubripirellula sp.]